MIVLSTYRQLLAKYRNSQTQIGMGTCIPKGRWGREKQIFEFYFAIHFTGFQVYRSGKAAHSVGNPSAQAAKYPQPRASNIGPAPLYHQRGRYIVEVPLRVAYEYGAPIGNASSSPAHKSGFNPYR